MEYCDEPIIQVDGDGQSQQGVAVPYERLDPDTLRRVISEFVTREWEEVGSTSYTLEQKISQVMSQLRSGKARLVFDLDANTCNIIPVP